MIKEQPSYPIEGPVQRPGEEINQLPRIGGQPPGAERDRLPRIGSDAPSEPQRKDDSPDKRRPPY